jgi:hypothetical protein
MTPPRHSERRGSVIINNLDLHEMSKNKTKFISSLYQGPQFATREAWENCYELMPRKARKCWTIRTNRQSQESCDGVVFETPLRLFCYVSRKLPSPSPVVHTLHHRSTQALLRHYKYHPKWDFVWEISCVRWARASGGPVRQASQNSMPSRAFHQGIVALKLSTGVASWQPSSIRDVEKFLFHNVIEQTCMASGS